MDCSKLQCSLRHHSQNGLWSTLQLFSHNVTLGHKLWHFVTFCYILWHLVAYCDILPLHFCTFQQCAKVPSSVPQKLTGSVPEVIHCWFYWVILFLAECSDLRYIFSYYLKWFHCLLLLYNADVSTIVLFVLLLLHINLSLLTPVYWPLVEINMILYTFVFLNVRIYCR